MFGTLLARRSLSRMVRPGRRFASQAGAEPPNYRSIVAVSGAVAPMRAPSHEFALIDLSGTLHEGASVVPNAPTAIKLLRSNGVQVRFLTNTSLTSRKRLLVQLRGIGFDEECIRDESEIITAASAACVSLKSRKLTPYLLIEDALLEDFEGLSGLGATHDCVLVGLAPNKFNYNSLNRAFRVLDSSSNAVLMAIHKAKFYKDSDGKLSLGPGPFVSGLEEASGKRAEIIGKPSALFFEAALKDLGCADPATCVMISDDLLGDIEGAQNVGVSGILVRTGKFLLKDETSKRVIPKGGVCDSIVDAVDQILGPEIFDTDEFVLHDGSPPLSPREEKMVKEIQSLRNKLKAIDPYDEPAQPKILFKTTDDAEGEVVSNENKELSGVKAEQGDETKEEEKEDAIEALVPAQDEGKDGAPKQDEEGKKEEAGTEPAAELPPTVSDKTSPMEIKERRKTVEADKSEKKKKKEKEKEKEKNDDNSEQIAALKDRLTKFYQKYAEDESFDQSLRDKAKKKLADGFDDLARKKVGKEDKLFRDLIKAYGPEPT